MVREQREPGRTHSCTLRQEDGAWPFLRRCAELGEGATPLAALWYIPPLVVSVVQNFSRVGALRERSRRSGRDPAALAPVL